MKTAKAEGKNIFGITVYLSDSCILKAARAFLVFKSVESKGELIKSVPTTEQIEDEEFELDFSWILATTDSKENIKNMILNVSEVAEVYIEDYVIPEAETESKEETKERDCKGRNRCGRKAETREKR